MLCYAVMLQKAASSVAPDAAANVKVLLVARVNDCAVAKSGR
jgi:hypothetical protein